MVGGWLGLALCSFQGSREPLGLTLSHDEVMMIIKFWQEHSMWIFTVQTESNSSIGDLLTDFHSFDHLDRPLPIFLSCFIQLYLVWLFQAWLYYFWPALTKFDSIQFDKYSHFLVQGAMIWANIWPADFCHDDSDHDYIKVKSWSPTKSWWWWLWWWCSMQGSEEPLRLLGTVYVGHCPSRA